MLQPAFSGRGDLRASPSPPDAAAGDRWLLMRILSAGKASPTLAERLIAEFGSVAAVLSASAERLSQLGADQAALGILGLMRETVHNVLNGRISERPMIDDGRAFAESMRADMAHLTVEQFRVAFLDAGDRLIRLEAMGTGSVSSAHIYPREVARRALELSASAVILVHNHPSGDPTPSPNDVQVTKTIAAALDAIGIALHDHIIVARKGCVSLRKRTTSS